MRGPRSFAILFSCLLGACQPSASGPGGDGSTVVGAAAGQIANLQTPCAGLFTGAQPEGAAGFDALREMGVRTIVSVDGARPDVAAAAARGMRYVHIPVTYAEVTTEQRLEIARAIRDLPGPVYLHCHH